MKLVPIRSVAKNKKGVKMCDLHSLCIKFIAFFVNIKLIKLSRSGTGKIEDLAKSTLMQESLFVLKLSPESQLKVLSKSPTELKIRFFLCHQLKSQYTGSF